MCLSPDPVSTSMWLTAPTIRPALRLTTHILRTGHMGKHSRVCRRLGSSLRKLIPSRPSLQDDS